MSGKGQRLGSELPSWQVAHRATCGGGAGGGLIARRNFTHSGANTEGEYTAITPSDSPVYSTAPEDYFSSLEGAKHYELKNHLGNVLATVSDKRDVEVDGSFNVESYTAKISDVSFYYPFGSLMPGLSDFGGEHRFGFGGHEKDNEVKQVAGAWYGFGDYGYDSRIARRPSPDPKIGKYPSFSSYLAFGDNPISYIDTDGEDIILAIKPKSNNNPKVQVDNFNKVINLLNSTDRGRALLATYMKDNTKNLYITFDDLKSGTRGLTESYYSNFNVSESKTPTMDIGGNSHMSDDESSFYGQLIENENADNRFITLDESTFGSDVLESGIDIKKAAKVLGHEIGAHANNPPDCSEAEGHTLWGQNSISDGAASGEAKQLNKEIDDVNLSSVKENLKLVNGKGEQKKVQADEE